MYLKKLYYKYIYKGLRPTFGRSFCIGKRVVFAPPPQRFSTLSEMICLFLYVCDMIQLFCIGYVCMCHVMRLSVPYACLCHIYDMLYDCVRYRVLRLVCRLTALPHRAASCLVLTDDPRSGANTRSVQQMYSICVQHFLQSEYEWFLIIYM